MGSTVWRRVSGLGLASLVGLVVLGAGSMPVLAQSCTAGCQSGQIRFTPGDQITVQVVNRSHVVVDLEQPPLTGPRTLRPGDEIELDFGRGTSPNISILFWTMRDRAIRLRLGRPDPETLSVEIYSAPSEPSHRSLFVENDGRVIIQ